ncbi:MAG TPA: helix-turn-helix domain-containing protein [Verrucomicrobiae bacterium]|nr:helix-turn-helix domain-containing protein [Verrucomicrobiae bacterium]
MLHEEFEPPEELRDTVKCFWYNRRDFGERQSSFEVLPDGYAEIIFHFGSGCSIVRSGSLWSLPSPFLMGLLDQPVLLSARGRFEVLGVRCFPWAVFDLLGLPSGKDEARVVEHPIAQLQSELDKWIHADKVDEAIAQLKQYFANLRSQIDLDGMLFNAGVAMRKASGTMPVSQVAAAAHATVRTLERKFKQSSGHTVKDLSGLMRFEQVRNRLWLYPDSSIAELAHELGYADQSHLSKEFKRYSGTTPAAFARKAKRRKLSVSSDVVAFIQAERGRSR